ncbi:MAG: PorV/PorQ family protein [candidate division KSB1 bacterium]|nr:PorV/PorQ family protein [candidate division KSB1 bacterium]
MMNTRFILLIAVLIVAVSAGQVFAVSDAAVLSLMISPGARAAGMGEAFVAVANDATAPFWNPAGLANIKNKELHFMHSKWLPNLADDLFYDFASFVYPMQDIGTFGVNVTFLNLGEQIHTDETGNQLGTFNSNEYSIAATYGTKLSQDWAVGLGLRYIRSNLSSVSVGAEQGDGIGNAFAFDLATMYTLPFHRKLTLGMNLSNMGPKITYVDAAQADPLPTNLKLGFAYNVVESEYNKLTVVGDLNKMMVTRDNDGSADPFYQALFTSPWMVEETTTTENDDGEEVTSTEKMFNGTVSGGLEYWYSGIFALRAGYYWDQPGEVEFFSFGGGVQYHLYRFDFAYVAADEGHPLANTMRFSLTIGV